MAAPSNLDQAKSQALSYGADAIDSQKELLQNALRLNTIMAWYQLAIALAGKVSGR